MNMSNDMNMIASSSDNIRMTGFVFQDYGYIREKYFLVLCCQKGSIIIGTKNNLIKNLGVSWHIYFFSSEYKVTYYLHQKMIKNQIFLFWFLQTISWSLEFNTSSVGWGPVWLPQTWLWLLEFDASGVFYNISSN